MSEGDRPIRQEKQRATTDIDELAPGVIRTQLPIDMPGLGHVNCYILEDERGIALVDPGLPGDEPWDALVDRLSRAGFKVADVHTVIVTHSHFDHFGGARRLREEAGAEILAHSSFGARWELDDPGEMVDLDNPDESDDNDNVVAPWDRRPQKTPWGTDTWRPPQEVIDEFERLGADGRFHLTPDPTIHVADAEVVKLARREWVAVHTPGHTDDHLCLYDPVEGIMISGDHVLPTITPHIGGITPAVDPLAKFFDSLRRMHDYSDVKLVLPAHGHPFDDLYGRADDIIEHHEERLDSLRDAAREGGEAVVNEYMKGLFRERSWGQMAESETYAHLQHLHCKGEMVTGEHEGQLTFALTDD